MAWGLVGILELFLAFLVDGEKLLLHVFTDWVALVRTGITPDIVVELDPLLELLAQKVGLV